MSPGTFMDTLLKLEAFKRILVFRPKIDFFFQAVSPWFLAKNDQFRIRLVLLDYVSRDLFVS